VNTRDFDDKAKLLENMIFLQIYRKTKEVSYYKDEYSECDFIICDSGKPKQALQVCYSLESDDTKQREINGLIRACKALSLTEGMILTYQSNEEFIEVDGIHVSFVSVVDYLLQ
jgi:predicted AAA+ superfamily ATPase